MGEVFGRTIGTSLLNGERTSRPVIVPFLEQLAARLSGISYAAMTADATTWVSGIQQADRLIGGDAVSIGFDVELVAEAVAANPDPQAVLQQGRLPTLLDSVRRLSDMTKESHIRLVGLAGPHLLARRGGCTLDAVKAACVAIAEEALKARPDIVVFLEDDLAADVAAVTPDLRRLYGTLRNVASYYGVASAVRVATDGDPVALAERLAPLRLDMLLLDGIAPTDPALLSGLAGWRAIGLAAPLSDEAAALAMARAVTSAPLFLTTHGQVPATADIQGIRETIRKIAEFA